MQKPGPTSGKHVETLDPKNHVGPRGQNRAMLRSCGPKSLLTARSLLARSHGRYRTAALYLMGQEEDNLPGPTTEH